MGAVVQRGERGVIELAAGDGRGEARGVVAIERRQGQLDRVAHPAQLGAEAPQAMGVGGHLVPGGDDQQQRHLPQLGGKVRQEQQGRLVRPVQIVEQHRDRPRAPPSP